MRLSYRPSTFQYGSRYLKDQNGTKFIDMGYIGGRDRRFHSKHDFSIDFNGDLWHLNNVTNFN